jgi:hypothetical protein
MERKYGCSLSLDSRVFDRRYTAPVIEYLGRKGDMYTHYASGAKIERLPKTLAWFPEGVLGMYHPASHKIILPLEYQLSNIDMKFVESHEGAHAMGERSEAKADSKATSETGHTLRILGDSSPLRRAA